MSTSTISPLAGKPAPHSILANIPRLLTTYFTNHPDPRIPSQRVAFGTSGHRGSAFDTSFNDDHIAAISQAIAEYRKSQKITGPLFIGMDTHALSEAAFTTAVEVLGANDVLLMVDAQNGFTPTPVISHAILTHNARHADSTSDGIVITPSHNPPEDGGIKYNPPHGGPADTQVTKWIEQRANQILENGLKDVKRIPFTRAMASPHTRRFDYISNYVNQLNDVIDFEIIKTAGLKIGVDPLGNASLAYWHPIAERYGLNITVVNETLDPTFRFLTVDWDGKIRMDCSSPYAMAGLVALKDQFDIAFANDTDADRHGIVTKSGGLMNPNHYLSVAIQYLFSNRSHWSAHAGIGKTIVSSSMIDRVAAKLGRKLIEVPVGFKWFVDGLFESSLGFVGEESAGASFLRSNGTVWTTDKDGIIMGLLAAEITARTGKDPSQHYHTLTEQFGAPFYERIDAPATPAQKARLLALAPEDVPVKELAGDPIIQMLTKAPGNNAPIGGLKVCTRNGWFAARPSGTENVYKIYAESFVGLDYLRNIQHEAKQIVLAACRETPNTPTE